MEARKVVMEQDYIWGSVTLPNGETVPAVLGEQDGRGYYAHIRDTNITGVVGFYDRESLKFDGWIDSSEWARKNISVLKVHKYLVSFGKTLRHPINSDVEYTLF